MDFPVKYGWLETRLVMASRTIRAGRPRCELPLVRILVAGLAAVVRNRPMEIAVLVTAPASQFGVLSNQNELCAVMIEARAWMIAFPAARCVALLAGTLELHILECSAMRVRMTTLTAAVGKAFEQRRLFVGDGGVTVFAENGLMKPG